jgi:ADP-ribosyl-[dinitrogen reductase] hydrolase
VSGKPGQADRVAGTLLGLATGDALGAGYEFGRPPPPGEAEMIGGGLGGWDRGEWTDDTQMAICIAKVAATGHLTAETVGQEFLAWYRDGPADVGNQTRAVLSCAASAADLPGYAAGYYRARPSHSAGNGSLMRTAPVALAHLGDDQAIAHAARQISALTHADPLAGDACVLWCIAIDRAVRKARLDGYTDALALLGAEEQRAWAERIEQARTAPPGSFTPNGFVVTAFQAAIAAIQHTPVPGDIPALHFQRALQAAVAIGDDTDTVAAIAGSLLGARWGASAVPLRWQRLLHGWPGPRSRHPIRSRDLIRYAVLTALHGRPDDVGWPTTPVLDYSGYGNISMLAEHPHDPGVLLGGVGRLRNLPTGVDAVVSLCRLGADEVPARGIRPEDHIEVWLIDSADPARNPNLDYVLTEAEEAIAALRAEGRKVLVHCVQAESRTPTVAALYAARHRGVSARQALTDIQRVLPRADPNPTFRAAVERLGPERPSMRVT